VDNTQNIISFCSGYGGLDRGIELAGVKTRTVAYVEIEAFAITNLVAKMETGLLVPAPLWTNLKTFPLERFSRRVHGITAGYPCQPFSCAGRRGGQMIQDTYGLSSKGQYQLFDHSGASLKTSKVTSRLDSPQSSAIWKNWVTKLRLDYSQRQKSGLRTDEKGSLSWPTPEAFTQRGPIQTEFNPEKGFTSYHGGVKHGAKIADAVRVIDQWQTPSVSTGAHRQKNGDMTKKLDGQVKTWPTPSSRDWKNTPGMATEAVNADGSKRDRTDQLARAIYNDGQPYPDQSNTNGKRRGSLNPDWVESLMGLEKHWTTPMGML